MSAAQNRTRLLLILGIVAVGLATLLVRQLLEQRRFEQAEAASDRPDVRARAALAEADQAVLNKDDAAARAALIRAREALDEAVALQPGDVRLLRSRLVVSRRLAAVALALGHKPEARELLEDALARAQALFDQDKLADRARLDLLAVARELGALVSELGEVGRAGQVVGEVAASIEAAQQALPGEAALQGELADAWLEAAEAHHTAKAPEEAARALLLGAARAEASTRGGEDPVGALARAYATVNRAARLAATLKRPEALDLARRAMRLLQEQKALAPENLSLDRSLAQWHSRLADEAEATGDDAAATTAHEAAINLRQILVSRQPQDPDARRDLVRALNSMGAFHSARKLDDAALVRYREAVEAAAPLGDDRTRLVALGNHAQLLGRLDLMAEAKTAAADAYGLAVRLAALPDAPAAAALDAVAAGLRHARLLRADPRPDRAAARVVVLAEQARLAALGDQAGARGAPLASGLAELLGEL